MCAVMILCWMIGFVYSMPPITLTTVAASDGKCLGFSSWPSPGKNSAIIRISFFFHSLFVNFKESYFDCVGCEVR